jgi:hypothetical protein
MAISAETHTTRGRLPLVRCAAAGALALGTLFVLCWIGAALGWADASHMYVSLFTLAPVASTTALGVGLCWSLAFGALGGTLVALAYNALAFLER